jgi:transitional endoplasmic reticulum ATPase
MAEASKKHTNQQSQDRKKVLDLLEEAGGKLVAEDDIVWGEGRTLIIPKSMTLQNAVDAIKAKIEQEDRFMEFQRIYRFRPWDGARATMRALKRAFGMVSHKGTPGFFGSPPQLITINVDVNETEQVPWGVFEIPVLPGVEFTLYSSDDPEYGTLFAVVAGGPRKHRFAVEGVFNLIQSELERESLYRGKAFNGAENPDFVDIKAVDRGKIVYSDETEAQLEANVWSLLRYTAKMRELRLPLKRAVLLEGPYGTGKTVGATITAQEAVANGWTFIYCRPGKDDVNQCMATARLYQPAVVFVEDVDTISDPENNSRDGVARLLDLFDGVSAKNTEIMVVMTTNHPEKIHKGMVRPGRLDAVIHIGELDSGGIERMTKVLIPAELLAMNVDWEQVGLAMAGFLPAYVKEAVDRAQRYNLARNDGVPTIIGTEDLVNAGLGLRPQLELMEGAPEASTQDTVGVAITKIVESAVNGADLIRGSKNPEASHHLETSDSK